jgi:SAM-dependent methyltransferase
MNFNEPLYEDAAREYAAHSAANAVNAAYERPAMLDLVGDVAGKTVLDAGCAGGEYAAHLLERRARVIAIDKSRAMVEIVRNRFGDALEVRRHDLNDPFDWLSDESIDLVVSSLTMHYLECWTAPLKEFRRVLKSNGRFIMSTHHPAMTAPLVENYFDTVLIDDTWKVGSRDYSVRFYHRPLQEIASALIDAGFTIERVVEPRLTHRPGELSDEWFQRLSREPWFLLVEAAARPRIENGRS